MKDWMLNSVEPDQMAHFEPYHLDLCCLQKPTIAKAYYIKAGVPEGSILGPLLFLLYINHAVQDMQSYVRLFVDDTSLYTIVDNSSNAEMLLNSDLETIHKWAETWLVKFNPSKSEKPTEIDSLH